MTTLKVHDENRQQIAAELHAQIEAYAESYAAAGIALMRMRDGEFYRDLPGMSYATFEDYVRHVRELTVRHARRLIQAALIHRCLADGGTNFVPPSYAQCEMLMEGSNRLVGFKTVKALLPQGGVKEVPSDVRNKDQVRRVWGEVCKKYEEKRRADLAKHPDKPPRKFTASFVNEHLPNQFQKEALIQVRRTKIYHRLIARTNKVAGQIERFHMHEFEGMKKVSEKDGWTKDDKAQLTHALRDLKFLIDGAYEAIQRVRV